MEPPTWYLEIARNVQDRLANARVESICMLSDVEKLIAHNQLVREGVIGESIEWPAELYAIGGDGGGNYFAIDPASPGSGVVVVDHENEVVEPLAPTLDDFVDWLIEHMATPP